MIPFIAKECHSKANQLLFESDNVNLKISFNDLVCLCFTSESVDSHLFINGLNEQ